MSTALLQSTVIAADNWDRPGPWWPLFPAFWLLIVAGVITAFVLAGRRRARMAGSRAGEARLAERFAAGEIEQQEYRDRLTVLKDQHR